MKPASPQKLKAYRQHWRAIASIQDEMWTQYIHQGLSLREVKEDAMLAHATVKRFFHRGKGNGKMGYSLFHGPTMTTVIGIAGAIGLELKLQPKKPNGSSK